MFLFCLTIILSYILNVYFLLGIYNGFMCTVGICRLMFIDIFDTMVSFICKKNKKILLSILFYFSAVGVTYLSVTR